MKLRAIKPYIFWIILILLSLWLGHRSLTDQIRHLSILMNSRVVQAKVISQTHRTEEGAESEGSPTYGVYDFVYEFELSGEGKIVGDDEVPEIDIDFPLAVVSIEYDSQNPNNNRVKGNGQTSKARLWFLAIITIVTSSGFIGYSLKMMVAEYRLQKRSRE